VEIGSRLYRVVGEELDFPFLRWLYGIEEGGQGCRRDSIIVMSIIIISIILDWCIVIVTITSSTNANAWQHQKMISGMVVDGKW
jgi:hypothetical protein